jgi:hypothetical protein
MKFFIPHIFFSSSPPPVIELVQSGTCPLSSHWTLIGHSQLDSRTRHSTAIGQLELNFVSENLIIASYFTINVIFCFENLIIATYFTINVILYIVTFHVLPIDLFPRTDSRIPVVQCNAKM